MDKQNKKDFIIPNEKVIKKTKVNKIFIAQPIYVNNKINPNDQQ